MGKNNFSKVILEGLLFHTHSLEYFLSLYSAITRENNRNNGSFSVLYINDFCSFLYSIIFCLVLLRLPAINVRASSKETLIWIYVLSVPPSLTPPLIELYFIYDKIKIDDQRNHCYWRRAYRAG